MGSACCVAAKDQTIPSRTEGESVRRNAVCSPLWNFRWDSWGRVAREIENPSIHTSRGVSINASMEFKGSLSSERGHFSDGGSTLENSVTPTSLKSPVREYLARNHTTPSSDISMASNCSAVVKNLIESPEIAECSIPNCATSPVFSTPTIDLMPNHNYHNFPTSVPSRWAHRSPGYPLSRQISDSRILGLKSPDTSISEGRPSFVLSNCSNDMASGSQCGSSDGWSMRTFSEMVVSSHQKERWSFDSEYSGSGRHKMSGTSSRFSYSPSMDVQSCGACSKLLTERTAWGSQKFMGSSDLSVVAVLACGHVYHAECLETMTSEADSCDPACPVCMIGEKHLSKLSKKGLRSESETKAKNYRISRNRVVDSYLDGGLDVFDRLKDVVSKMEPSSSRRPSFGKPFLRRRFSLGSKWSRSLLENDSVRKKGFWARYRKD